MLKGFLRKLMVALSGLFVFVWSHAEVSPDSVVMTVGDKPVSLSEFLFIAQKNNASSELDLKDRATMESYVELFKNFKLKVADAESLRMDKTSAFTKELEEYRSQLISGYMSDQEGERQAVYNVFERGDSVVELTHILFRLPEKTVSKDTVAVYEEAMEAYQRLVNGEEIAVLGKELAEKNKGHVAYEHMRCMYPMQTAKEFEAAAYSLPIGVISKPVRTRLGFHLIQVHRRQRNPGKIRVAHILIGFPKDTTVVDTAAVLAKAKHIREHVLAGDDFGELAKAYSDDEASAKRGGRLSLFGLGEMVQPFEEAAFALKEPGDISDLVETRFGYHIIQLIERKERKFEDEEPALTKRMAQGDRNFEFYAAFDERMKREYGYMFYPEAYQELQALCDEHFPTDAAFFEKAKGMTRTLVHLNEVDVSQAEFAYYIQRCPFSTKTYAGDFMREIYDLFIRDILTTAERKNLEVKHPEIPLLMQEYRDGILLFNVSNRKVWSKPAAEQEALEAEWIADLNKKYPVTVNWTLLESLMK